MTYWFKVHFAKIFISNIFYIDKMENMKVPELKSLAKERGLRYSKLRKAELIAFIQEGNPPPPPSTPPPPPPQHSQRGVEGNQGGVRFRPDRPRQPELLKQLEEQMNPPNKEI